MAKKRSHLSPAESRSGYMSEPNVTGRSMQRNVKNEQRSKSNTERDMGVHHDEGSIEEGRGESMSGAEAGAKLIHSKRYYGAGQGDFANMPREVRMEQYPKDPYGVGIDYADNYDRVQEIQGGSNRNMRRQLSKEMY